MITMDKLLTVKEVAQLLRLSEDTVSRMLKQKRLPGYKVEGSWRIGEQDLLEYMNRQKNTNIQDK